MIANDNHHQIGLSENHHHHQARLQLEEGGSFSWAWHRLLPHHSSNLPGFTFIQNVLWSSLRFKCGNVLAKKMTANTFVMVLWREICLVPQVIFHKKCSHQ